MDLGLLVVVGIAIVGLIVHGMYDNKKKYELREKEIDLEKAKIELEKKKLEVSGKTE